MNTPRHCYRTRNNMRIGCFQARPEAKTLAHSCVCRMICQIPSQPQIYIRFRFDLLEGLSQIGDCARVPCELQVAVQCGAVVREREFKKRQTVNVQRRLFAQLVTHRELSNCIVWCLIPSTCVIIRSFNCISSLYLPSPLLDASHFSILFFR